MTKSQGPYVKWEEQLCPDEDSHPPRGGRGGSGGGAVLWEMEMFYNWIVIMVAQLWKSAKKKIELSIWNR